MGYRGPNTGCVGLFHERMNRFANPMSRFEGSRSCFGLLESQAGTLRRHFGLSDGLAEGLGRHFGLIESLAEGLRRCFCLLESLAEVPWIDFPPPEDLFPHLRTFGEGPGHGFGLGETDFRLWEPFERVLEAGFGFWRPLGRSFGLLETSGTEFWPPGDLWDGVLASWRPLGPGFGLWEPFERVLEAGFGFWEGPGGGFVVWEARSGVWEARFGVWEAQFGVWEAQFGV